MSEDFHSSRPRLFGIAYRMLGSVAEAEDMVQETYLRWQRQERTSVEEPAAWLVTTVSRLCIDELRSARRRREEYVGTWLPEPLLDTSLLAPDQAAARTDSLNLAFLLMLEMLEPVERAVFLLREAFDYDYAAIARIVAKSEANCRQMVSRAKTRLRDQPAPAGPPSEQAQAVVQRFMAAWVAGDLPALLRLLSEDVVLYADGGGRVRSAIRPIHTAAQVGQFLVEIRQRSVEGAEFSLVSVNGDVGVWMRRPDGIVSVTAYRIDGGRIHSIYAVVNPEKLQHVAAPRPVG
ncbi:RNA polymerase sigma-70 factor [Opitutus terrae]|uniref:RNA polymerase, sigma-24 subunit, ECF subfamily n=1 Tax=Opitutus terrae (strain DSM 11246 / JCM 15787 / PB90-1) TaxID=452637 RepID=B1ZZL1_OPITP|nr:RNA polymerase sigma-70 factor [Opitutus terrae]ACB76414.1 RNA polymerase, sigma-24 subunit, ECF subfamily [Opitutus terrae PB90-1]